MRRSLEKFLEESGHFNTAQIGDAQRTQQFFGGSLLSNMVRLGYVTERKAGDYFAAWSGYPYIAYSELKNRPIREAVLAFLTAKEAARRQIVPFLLEDGRLEVVTCRADNAVFFHELERQHDLEVVPHIIADERLEALLEQHYDIPATRKKAVRPVTIRDGSDPTSSVTASGSQEEQTTGLSPDIGLDGLPVDSEAPAAQIVGQRVDHPFVADLPSPDDLMAPPEASWQGVSSREEVVTDRLDDRSPPALPPGLTPGGTVTQPPEPDQPPLEPPAAPVSTTPSTPGSNPQESASGASRPTPSAAEAPGAPRGLHSRLRRLADTPLLVLSKALDRETIGEAAVELVLHLGAQRVALLSHQEERLVGWHTGGAGVTLARVRRLSLPLYAPSIFSALRVNAAPYIGIVPAQPANQELLAALGGRAPKIAAAVPVMLKGRMVAVIYADGGPDASHLLDLKQFQDAANKLSLSLEILLLRKKIGGA